MVFLFIYLFIMGICVGIVECIGVSLQLVSLSAACTHKFELHTLSWFVPRTEDNRKGIVVYLCTFL